MNDQDKDEKKRDRLAQAHYDHREHLFKNSMHEFSQEIIAVESFKLGWDAHYNLTEASEVWPREAWDKIQSMERENLARIDYRKEVLRNRPDFATSSLESKLSMGGLGVAGEAGEVADLIKKILFHDKPLDLGTRQKLLHEIGDVHWYLEFLAASLEVDTEEIKAMNVNKLRERYPEPPKFNPPQKLRHTWPKDVVSYLIMLATFPIWFLGRAVNPGGTDTYFIDRVHDQKMLTVSLDDLAEIFAASYIGSHGLSDCWENMKRQLSPDDVTGDK